MNSKTTLYLDQKILKAAKIKAAHTEKSLSDLVNEALRQSLREDAADYDAFKKRAKEPARNLRSAVLSRKGHGRAKDQMSRLVRFFKESPFHGVDLELERNRSLSRKTGL